MEGIASISTTGISLNSILRASSGSGRISLAVPASAVPYAGLRHITLTPLPVSGGSKGFSITKLRALDVLIDILSKEGKMDAAHRTADSSPSPERVDDLVARYSKQLKDLAANRRQYMPAVNLKGLLVNGLV